jgi:hypothetical protein
MNAIFNARLLLAISSAACLSACSSGDIVVKSDLGEEMIIKESAVTISTVDREQVKQRAAETFNIWADYSEEKCRAEQEFLQGMCWAAHRGNYLPAKANLDAAASLPGMTYVKYRSIVRDVNGDKKASGYEYLLCLPQKATQEQKVQWAEIAAYGVPSKREEKISTNIVNDGTVASQASRALCDKYAKS